MNVLAFLVIACIFFGILLSLGADKLKQKKDAIIDENNIEGDCFVGFYLFDLPGAESSKQEVHCGLSGESVVFFTYDGILGRIALKNIICVYVDDKSQVFKTASGGVIGLGGYAADIKKTTENRFVLVINWKDEREIEYNTSFEIKGPKAKSQIQKAVDQMKEYMSKKNFRERLAATAGLDISPKDYLLKAQSLLQNERYGEVIAICSKLLQFLPDNSDALYIRALGNHHQGNVPQALADAKAAATLGNQKALRYLADFHPNFFKTLAVKEGRLEEVVEDNT